MSFARIIVDSRVRVHMRDVGDAVVDRLKESVEHKNPKHAQLVAMGYRFDHRKEPRIIKLWREEEPWLSLPRGAMSRVRAILNDAGIDLRVKDARTLGTDHILEGFEWPSHTMTPYPDQELALKVMLAKENCYIRAPTAAGKTVLCTLALDAIRRPAIVIVWTGSLFDDWVERVQTEMGFPREAIGEVRGGKKRVGPVTIAMQQTIAKMKPTDLFFQFFGVVICDELQKFSAPTFVASIDPFGAKYRIGVSADERRKDRKEFMAHDLFGDMAISIERKELVEKGRVREVEMRLVPTGWQWKGENDPPSSSEEEETLSEEKKSSPNEFGEQIDAMAESEERDAKVLEIVREEVKKGEQVIIFTLRKEHARKLSFAINQAGITCGLMIGGDENREKMRDAIAAVKAKRMQVAVGTTKAVGTGVNLPKLGVGILTMPVVNPQELNQFAGRISRIGGGLTPARFYVLVDPCRRSDFRIYFADDRPVFVRCLDGTWIDARHHRRRAKEIAYPKVELTPWLTQ